MNLVVRLIGQVHAFQRRLSFGLHLCSPDASTLVRLLVPSTSLLFLERGSGRYPIQARLSRALKRPSS